MSAVSAAAQSASCTGPFAQCARQVAAKCDVDDDGVQHIYYIDYSGLSTQFERCVANVYTSKGYPNPYLTGEIPDVPDLAFPRSEGIPPKSNN